MDSAGGPVQHEGKWTSGDLEVRDDESHNIPSLLYGGIDKCWGLTQSSIRNIDEGYSELDPLLPNGHLWPSIDDEEKMSTGAQTMPSESICTMVLQILAPFLLAGFGTVMAGMLLDIVQVSMAGLWAQKGFGFKWQSKILCLGEAALGRVSEGNRDLHPGASITWHERQPGDDTGIKALYSGE